jgi:hypothetical protein
VRNFNINWYQPSTDDTLKRAMPGEILRLSAWTGGAVDTWLHVRVTSEPETRTTWHGSVDRSTFWRREWLEFQIIFGELVFNHAKGVFPRPEPIWETFPEGRPSRLTVPAAVAYRFKEEHRIPVACIWLGEPGQKPDEFRREVLTALPLTVEERFAFRDNQPVTVLVAAEPSRERDANDPCYSSGDLDYVMMHLLADCGRVLNGDPEPGRSLTNLVLDALGVPTTHKE